MARKKSYASDHWIIRRGTTAYVMTCYNFQHEFERTYYGVVDDFGVLRPVQRDPKCWEQINKDGL